LENDSKLKKKIASKKLMALSSFFSFWFVSSRFGNESFLQNAFSQLCAWRLACWQHHGSRFVFGRLSFFAFFCYLLADETVTFLDAGIVIELSPRQSSNFWSLFRVLVNRDANAAANLLLDRGGRCANTNESQFRLDIGKAFSQLPSTFSALESENRSLAGALMQVLNSARNNRVLLDSSFVSLITSCVVLEGTGLRLDPSISLFDMAKEMAKSQLT